MTTEVFTSSGTWTCPVGVTTVTVKMWGAGGGGGEKDGFTFRGFGGGGGAYAQSDVSVVGGTNYDIVVGTGGTVIYPVSSDGGDSSFELTGTPLVLAKGGGGGTSTGSSGAGGSAAASTGTIKFSGGSTGHGDGAAAANSTSNGPSSAASTGDGGNGGLGANGSFPATNPTAPGGGGGGAELGFGGAGSDGARGQVILIYTRATSTTRYWVGGTGTWNTLGTANWSTTSGGSSGATPPISTSDVIFDANSGAGTVTYNPTSAFNIQSLDFTGFTGTFAGSGVALNVADSLTLGSGMTWSASHNMLLNGSSATAAIVGNSVSIASNLQINGTGTWTVLSYLPMPSKILTLTQGTLDISPSIITAGTFTSTGTSTRTIKLGYLQLNGSGTLWTASGSNFTVSGTGTIELTATGTFAGGGLTYPTLDLDATGTFTITGSNTFNTISGSTSADLTLTSGTTTTVTNFTLQGASTSNYALIRSSTPGSQATLTKAGGGTITVEFMDIQDSNATPASTWTALRSLDNGNNTGWSFGGAHRMFLVF